MNEPLELSPNVWLDESSNTIVIGMDRISVAFEAAEFWDFCNNIEIAKINIECHPDFTVGTYEENGVEKTQLMLNPQGDDFN
jgi:hypothetical protein